MRTLLQLITLSCFLVACTGQKNGTKDPFPLYNIQGKLYEGTEIFARYPRLFRMDSLLIAYSGIPHISGKFLSVYDTHDNMKHVGDYISQGRGPGEFMQMDLNSIHGSRLFARNMNMRELAVMEVATDSTCLEVREIERLGFETITRDDISFEERNITYLDDEHFLAVSYGGTGEFFSLYDDRMNWLAHFGDGPVDEVLDGGNARSMLYGHLAVDDGEFVFAAATIPKLLFYKKTGDIPEKIWEDTFYESYYKVENKHINLHPDKTVGLVRGIELEKKYLYVLFLDATWGDSYERGVSSANIVLVFDRQGKRVARLNLDYRLQSICLDKDEKTLYGIAETPEYMIVSFDLPIFEG